MSDKKERKEIKRYEKNPFLEGMVIPKKNKQIQMSRLGKDDNVLINQRTGEVNGTHITTYKKVDAEQFIKLFTANVGLTFNLKAAGIKALSVLIWVLQHNQISRDVVPLDKFALEDFIEAHKNSKPKIKLSQATFWRGLADLEDAKIIAKHLRQGWYFINPNFVFNGDRIAFTTLIERDFEAPEKIQNEDQTEMFDNKE